MREAVKFKKEGKLAIAYSYKGIGHAKTDSNDTPIQVTSISMLENRVMSSNNTFRSGLETN